MGVLGRVDGMTGCGQRGLAWLVGDGWGRREDGRRGILACGYPGCFLTGRGFVFGVVDVGLGRPVFSRLGIPRLVVAGGEGRRMLYVMSRNG